MIEAGKDEIKRRVREGVGKGWDVTVIVKGIDDFGLMGGS